MESLRHLLLLLLFAASAATVAAEDVIRLPSDNLYCDSWRVSVEANNAQYWRTIPARCVDFVEEYMNGERYASDSDVVAAETLAFAETVEIGGDGKDVWIFDIDETLLSNLPYYTVNGYGSKIFNQTSWNEWEHLGKAAALPASLKLYNDLLGLGFQMVLLTGRREARRNLTEQNLLSSGYHSWERLILRDGAMPALEKFEGLGKHLISGNLQWSTNRKGEQIWKPKGSLSMGTLEINGVTCLAHQWLTDPSSSQTLCTTLSDNVVDDGISKDLNTFTGNSVC